MAVSLAHGFPVWYRDAGGLKLELCLDSRTEIAPGFVVEPCALENPFLNAPVSFPSNFGSEAFYWSAVSAGTYISSGGSLNFALLVLAQEAGFADEAPAADGRQAVFGRIRIRIDVPVAGTYRVTHPFGSREYVVTTPGARAINQTQDRGIATALDFLASMVDGPAAPDPVAPSVNVGAVNADGATIGPFLRPTLPHGGVLDPLRPETFAGGPVTLGGASYIGLPFAPDAANPTLPFEIFQPIGAVGEVDYFEIALLNPPPGFLLDAAGVDGTPDNVVRFSGFQVLGKIFDDGPNVAPVAEDDTAGVAPDGIVAIDVLANDADPPGPGNAHGIHPQAIALVHPNGTLVRVRGPDGEPGIPTPAGGRARRVTNILTGKTRILYTPPIGFLGTDSFRYVVQDRGGLVSEPATATVVIEELRTDRAEYRPRFGKWLVTGTTTKPLGNEVTLTTGPLAFLRGADVAPPVSTGARGDAGLRIGTDAIEFALRIDPLPSSAVIGAYIRAGAPGENGPVLFTLYDRLFHGVFTGSRSGVLGADDLQPRAEREINTLRDAVAAIRAGDAYIDVRTAGHPAGELRGRLVQPRLGTAAVRPDIGTWRFEGKSTAGPGLLPGVNAHSANGVPAPAVPLRLR